MNTAEVLVAGLEREGVEYVFGLPGEENEATMFALRDSDITFVPVRHEQGAAFMADVYGRLTGDAGVCLSTLGPGATNLLTGVADANLDKAPLVAITGQGSLESLHVESHQKLDVVDMFAPVTKWNAQISDPGIVHESVRKAFKTAEYEKPGATHLELPEDVAYEDCEVEPMESRGRVRRPEPDVPSLDRVRDLLGDADRPIVIAGNGAVRTDASEDLRAFVGKYDLPVAATYMGKGAVSDADDHSLLTLDSGDHEEASDAIKSADLVITVGYDIAEHDPADWNPDADTTIVHVDSEPAEVYEHYNPDVEVVSDIAAAVRELDACCEEIDADFETDWYDDLREHILDDVSHDHESGDPFTVERVLPVLREAMADDDVLISDVGSHKMAIAQNYPTYEPNTCIVSNGLASMGISVPGGLAADLAVDSNVVAATGDGGFMMNAAEIETATRVGCGYTILLFRDDEYRLITEEQVEHRGEHFGTELSNPDFQTFAESFGIEAYRPGDWDELAEALDEAVPSDEVSLVEVVLE
ncbi:acetolactate synthase large subunit (plasmid) [Halorussus limi]|uniref:Acetolactate synthase large subunit n=1 Tax=Halorussus limi TaxID=2938695 RepID=A0A8U0HZI9_9EURY|nr:acetolactate synthase large subunit [Halorussus limi]UPV76562.1 acetolactate synthase large subunit [Halorussus limi]